jgi:hypothetical protein
VTVNGTLRSRLHHLPTPLLAEAALAVVAAVVGGVVRGGTGALGALAGVVLVAASYTGSSVVLAWADRVNPRLVLPVGLVTYAVKFLLLGLLMLAVAATGWGGLEPMGFAIVAAALTWSVAQAAWTWRARIPYVEIPSVEVQLDRAETDR